VIVMRYTLAYSHDLLACRRSPHSGPPPADKGQPPTFQVTVAVTVFGHGPQSGAILLPPIRNRQKPSRYAVTAIPNHSRSHSVSPVSAGTTDLGVTGSTPVGRTTESTTSVHSPSSSSSRFYPARLPRFTASRKWPGARWHIGELSEYHDARESRSLKPTFSLCDGK